MSFYYCDAPAGAGKTYAIQKLAAKKVRQGENVLIVQPTKDLIDETTSLLAKRGVLYHVIHSENANGRVIAEITNYLKRPHPEPHVLLITWSAFEQIPYFNRPSDWHLFVDEVPQIHTFKCFKARMTHWFLTDHVSVQTVGPTYSRLLVKNKTALRKLSEEGAKDDAAKGYAEIARMLLSGNWELYVDQAHFSDLLKGKKKELKIFGLMQHTIFHGFSSRTIAAAHFQETLLYKLWDSRGIEFSAHNELTKSLRYTHHNVKNVKIFYGFEKNWSKWFRDRNGRKAWKQYIEAIEKNIGSEKLLWLANKDVVESPFHGDVNAQRLPNIPHGLNAYQFEYDSFASLSALNPKSEHFKLLKFAGMTEEDVKIATYRHAVYQAAMRCSLRDPENQKPKKIFVPDLATALWLQSILIGSEVVFLGIENDEPSPPKKRGAPKKHQSDNDRKAAYRDREKQRLEVIIDKIYHRAKLISGSDHEQQFSIKSCDENTFIEVNDNIQMDIGEEQILRFHGTLWGHEYATTPSHYAMFSSHEYLIEILHRMSKMEISDKDHITFISPTCFVGKEGVETLRGIDNVSFSRGIWLDFDQGNLTPKIFGSIFPKLRFVAYSTWSSTKAQPRWRAYIPTDGIMDAEQYKQITSEILGKLISYGYNWEKVDPTNRKKLAHGLDLSKLGPVSLFKLPCQSSDKGGSFFRHFQTNRDVLNVKEWLAFGHVKKGPRAEFEDIETQLVSDDAIERVVEHWRSMVAQPGTGDAGMYGLAVDLNRLGLRGTRLEEILLKEASLANSPKDRLRQIKRIMKGLNRKRP